MWSRIDASSGTIAEFSPQFYARVGGMLYLLIIAAGLFAEVLGRERFIVAGDGAATAGNIMARPFMFRLGIAADLTTFLCAVALSVILFALLEHVSRTAALLMLTFNLVQDAIGSLNALNIYLPLQLLGGAESLKAFNPQQLQALAIVSLNAHEVGFAVALMFFAFSCIALGYLIFTSGFLPKALGLLMAIAGGSYLVNSFVRILFPRLTAIVSPPILLFALIGELSFAMWLTVKGVNAVAWHEKTGR